MVDLKNFEEAINRACVSRSSSDSDLDNFLQHCLQIDNQITVIQMMVLKEKWKQNRAKTRIVASTIQT